MVSVKVAAQKLNISAYAHDTCGVSPRFARENEMRQTNLLAEGASFDNLVGVPASLRTRLGMNTINTSLAVSRDTRFLFKKHLNIQLVSLLAWLFTILQTVEVFGIDPLVATVVFILLLPVVLYLALSSERSRVRPLDKR